MAKALGRFGELPLFVQNRAQVGACLHVVGMLAQDLPKAFLRLGKYLLLKKNDAEVVARRRMVRIEM